MKELEGAHVGELESRLRRVQSQLAAQSDKEFHAVLDEFVGTGTQVAAQMLVDRMPFLRSVPSRVTSKLAVGLDNANGWELLKALPVNRRQRKRLHGSHSWVLSLCSGAGDPRLRSQCQATGYELVEVDLVKSQAWNLNNESLWKALLWAAFTGRVVAVLADPPVRTWNQVQTHESPAVKVRSYEEPWGTNSLRASTQKRVDEDTLLGVQPLWLWTVASVSKGEGIPFCYTTGCPGADDVKAWDELVTKPFAVWSNCTSKDVPWALEWGKWTRPLKVCSNLGLTAQGLKGLGTGDPKPDTCTARWPEGFKRQVCSALFNPGPGLASGNANPTVRAVGQDDKRVVAGCDPLQEGELLRELDAIPLEGDPVEQIAQGFETAKAQSGKPGDQEKGPSSSLTKAQREGWRRHLEAHHIPFRKDCLQCVMSGGLGLQHRRSKCPNMYALSFDLAGPFKELGKDERGGKYKYALVAGLRVPCEALPPEKKGRRSSKGETTKEHSPEPVEAPTTARASKGSELPPEEGQCEEEQDETHSVASLFDPSDYDPEEFKEDVELQEEPCAPQGEESLEHWEDHQGISRLSDDEFDKEIAKLEFSGENRVLRFVVPMKGRSGSQILPALQEVITECHRLGFPVRTAHTDRAREAVSKTTTDWLQSQLIQPSFTQGDDPKANGLAERLVGWVKTKARLHLSASGLGFEHWPTAMALACAQHRHQTLQLPGRVHQYGQRVVFKSKHPTGESKKPFLRWEYGMYLCPCPRTDQGHVLLRESSGGYLIARNVRPFDELVDPERELPERPSLEAQVEEEVIGESTKVPRRVTGKRSVRVVSLASEQLAYELRMQNDYSPDACSRLLRVAFGSAVHHSRTSHRGPVSFSIVLGAYGHGGIRGITKATQVYPQLCRYVNEYLHQGAKALQGSLKWSAITIMQADEVGVHRDSRNEPGTFNFLSTVADRTLWVSQHTPSTVQGSTRVDEARTLSVGRGVEEDGCEHHVGNAVIAFDPKIRHALSPASNWVIAGYSPLGTGKLAAESIARLRELGFDMPSLSECDGIQVRKVVGPNPQRLSVPEHRQRQRGPMQTRHMNVRFARIPPEEWRVLCELDEAQFEQGIERWTRVLSGADEPGMNQLSASIPRGLMIGTLRDGRQWTQDPVLEYRLPTGVLVPVARVLQYTDDESMYLDDSPFPDRMMMFDILDIQRDIREVVVIRVVIDETQGVDGPEEVRALQVPGPEPPEIMAVQAVDAYQGCTSSAGVGVSSAPRHLPVPLPNPTALKSRTTGGYVIPAPGQEELLVCKAEAATTNNLEELLKGLQEPLSVTHTASQGEVRQNLERWKPSIQKELSTLKDPGVLKSHFGDEARQLLTSAGATVIPLKGVFTAKAPSSGSAEMYRRKCRLVACGNQAPYNDAESLYASGAPAELVRAALVQASSHQWGAFTCDIRSAFTLTPIPPEAGRRYVLRPPRWLIELGLAQEDECYTLGKVLYGFRESPVWWASYRDEVLREAVFAGCKLVQGQADSSVWKIQEGEELKGYLITYVDDFLILGEASTAHALHKWILETAKWETDGLSEAEEGGPVRFLGMQLERYSDGSFTLDQEAYVDEIIRSHGLTSTMRSKITCPREVMYGAYEASGDESPGSEAKGEEQTLKLAQRIAGECLWLAQRTRVDIAYTTSVMCSLVSTDAEKAVSIGKRLLMYLAQTREYKLRMKAVAGTAVLRIYTDASFAPEGKNSYGGHILEFRGTPVVWRAGRQQLIAMSSAEAELIQVVEGSTYGESFIALLRDLGVTCTGAQVNVDNTASISLVKGGCSQRTRHLKVRASKLNQLLQQGWELNHCQGVYQKADILTKPLPSARLKFLCDLLGLGVGVKDQAEVPKERKVQGHGKVFKVCLVGLMTSLQSVVCKGQEEEDQALQVDYPWELLMATVLIVLSTVCLWETLRGRMPRGQPGREDEAPKVRAVSLSKERKAKRLQEKVQAAITSVVNETSPSGGSEPSVRARKGRNKCPSDRSP